MKDAMTDHKAHVRVLKGFAAAYTGETGEAFRAAIEALTAAHAASEGEDGAVACPCCGAPCATQHASGDGGHWREYVYTRPAAQVAATPKHDEGREDASRTRHVERLMALRNEGGETFIMPEDIEALDAALDALLALATQPAARRVTDDPRVAELIAAGRQLAGVNALMTGEPDRDAATWHDTDSRFRAALESFAQPAEGVSGG